VIIRSSSTWAALAALFAARAVMPVTAQPEASCFLSVNGPGGQEFRRCLSRELRLAISSETEALISDLVVEAHAEACRRVSQASSDSLARDWSVVAATIARRSGRRSSVLDAYSVEQADPIRGHSAVAAATPDKRFFIDRFSILLCNGDVRSGSFAKDSRAAKTQEAQGGKAEAKHHPRGRFGG
jgi:hypothetical protein